MSGSQFHWCAHKLPFFPARIHALGQALRSRYSGGIAINHHLRAGVFVLFHEYIEWFTGDVRFASDADEAGGLLVDASLSLIATIFQRRSEDLNGCRAQEAREETGGSSVHDGWFAGVGTLMCRHCGKRDPVGQVSEGLAVGKDEGGVPQEKEAEPQQETDVCEKTDDDEEESGWTKICREN